MEHLINLLEKNDKNKKMIDSRQIEIVVRRLSDLYNAPVSDVSYSKDISLYGFNYLDDSLLYNDIGVYRNIMRIYKSLCLDCSFETFMNLKSYFYIAHEIRHSIQKNDKDIIFPLKEIYQSSIEYQCYEPSDAYGRLILIKKRNIYSNNHDSFIIEVNADLFAYLFILEIIEKANLENKDKILSYFNKEFMSRLMKSYKINDDLVESLCEKFHVDIVDPLFDLESISGLDIQSCLMNGLRVDEKVLKKVKSIQDLKTLV